MSLPNLPVETWQMILEESIALPTFLDADCLPEVTNPLFDPWMHREHCGYHSAYWKTERCRNLLCRVCKSWNTHLLKFEHRYVQLSDVIHHNVPEEALAKAIRIAFRPCADHSCSECLREVNLSYFTALEAISAQIIEGCGEQVTQLLAKMHIKMPQLQAICMSDIIACWVTSLSHLPLLRHGYFQVGGVEEWTDYPGTNLVTLAISDYTQSGFSVLEKCDFNALQHFRIDSLSPALKDIDGLWPFLKRIGHNLRSLLLGRYTSTFNLAIREDIWELCPRIERLDTSVSIPHFPPPDHPLHTVSYTVTDSGEMPFNSDIGGFPSLRRLISQEGWGCYHASTREEALHWTRTLFEQCTRYGVILEDCDGVMFVDSGIGLSNV